MQQHTLDSKLCQILLKEGFEILQEEGVNVFDLREGSGQLVVKKGSRHDSDDIKAYLYDLALVAKFYCRTGSWIDRITLSGGQLWLWTYYHLPAKPCHVVIQLDQEKGLLLFPEGKHVCSPVNGLCFGIMFHQL